MEVPHRIPTNLAPKQLNTNSTGLVQRERPVNFSTQNLKVMLLREGSNVSTPLPPARASSPGTTAVKSPMCLTLINARVA